MKPFRGRSYGSIPHLFGSCSCGDKFVGIDQHRIATEKTRDKNDLIIVQEKLDGANVGILRKDGILIPISRNGHRCDDSTYSQHRIFHQWVMQHYNKFDWLEENEILCGEWMILAHGTKYNVKNPLIVFDLMGDYGRLAHDEFGRRLPKIFTAPALLHVGGSFSIEDAMRMLGTFGHHDGLEEVEGAVWRVERNGKIDFIAKYLRRPPNTIGRYLGHEKYKLWNVDIDLFRRNLPWQI
jgi:hypothetical protein